MPHGRDDRKCLRGIDLNKDLWAETGSRMRKRRKQDKSGAYG